MLGLIEELTTKAHSLPPNELAWFAPEILVSAYESQTDIEAAWGDEIQRRIAQIESGEAKLIPAEEVFAEVRGLL